MKIDSNPSNPILQTKVKPVGKIDVNPAPAKIMTENKINKQSSQKRITLWFSQAGIKTNHDNLEGPTLEEKIKLKTKILTQRKLTNLENILGLALDFCLDDGKDENLDPDWFFSFVNMAEEIFSPTMQELWGKIFAVETARPGSFSLQTLRVLKRLTQKDAQAFRHAVNLTSHRKSESTPILLLGYYQKTTVWSFFQAHKEQQLNLAKYGLSYPDLLSLMDLGLVHHSEIESGELPKDMTTEWRCAGQSFNLNAKRTGITLVYYKFTTTGAELCKLVNRMKHGVYIKELNNTLAGAFNIS
jgi:uncharacterized repeat protein (TIGR03899 family)